MSAIYGVAATLPDGTQHEVYEGTDYTSAERLAISTYQLHRGTAYVSVLLDGGTWRDVKHVPGDLSSARVTQSGGCLHSQCGQINPLSCYCGQSMTEQERERYR